MTRLGSIFTFFIALFFLQTNAYAQFKGDVFFKEPSVSTQEGGVAELEVQSFVGADPIGAIHFEIVFNPDQVEIESIGTGDSNEFQNAFKAKEGFDGVISIITMNDTSRTEPFGTVSLAKIRVRPLTAAGTTINFGINVRKLLGSDDSPFPANQGFSGEVIVTSATSLRSFALSSPEINNTSPVSELQMIQDGPLSQKAAQFRRPGEVVLIKKLSQTNGIYSAQDIPIVAKP